MKVTKQGNLNISKKLNDLNKLIKGKELNSELVDIAYDQFIKSFPQSKTATGGRQTDNSATGWVKRQDNPNNPPLVKTGKLKESIKKTKDTVYTNLNYAKYHNEGSGWLPKREFIGKSTKLIRKSKKRIKMILNKIFK